MFFITTDGAGEYVAALKLYGDNDSSLQSLTDQNHIDWMRTGGSGDDNDEAGPNTSGSNSVPTSDRNSDAESENEDGEFEEGDFIRVADEGENGDDVFHLLALVEDEDDQNPSAKLGMMNRIACSSHRLEKIGRVDALQASEDEAYKTSYDIAFNVLEKLWEEKHCRLNSEIFHHITGRRLIGPHRIRWMKTYDAVSDTQ